MELEKAQQKLLSYFIFNEENTTFLKKKKHPLTICEEKMIPSFSYQKHLPYPKDILQPGKLLFFPVKSVNQSRSIMFLMY